MRRAPLMSLLLMLSSPLAAQAGAPPPLSSAPAPVTGNAAAGLMSRTARGEVHLVVDPRLVDRRMVLKIVVLNRDGQLQPFGPDAVTVTADGQPIALATRADLVSRPAGEGVRDPSNARTTAPLLTNGAGQTDVTGFTGGSSLAVGGVPSDSLNRAGRGDASAPDPIDAVLLKPITLAPGAADGGQVFTTKLKRERGRPLEIDVTFAGETHRFAVTAPR